MKPPDLTAKFLRQAALAYAEAGWHVFPLHGVRPSPNGDGRLVCTCGVLACRNPGKHPAPAAPNGYIEATTLRAKIERWWPNDAAPWNIGIRTGKRSRLYVFDVPTGHDAPAELPRTLVVETGTGGHHLYYQHPGLVPWPNASHVLGDDVLTRGDGGFVIAPPSRHINGGSYRWIPHDIAKLPPEILDRIRPDRPEPVVTMDSSSLLDAVAAPTPSEADDDDAPGAYSVFAGEVEDPARALRALADALCRVDVSHSTIVRTIVDANDRHCHGALAQRDAEDIADAAKGAEVERRIIRDNNATKNARPADSKTASGQRAMRIDAARTRERGPLGAVRAYLLAFLAVEEYDVDSGELAIVWHDGGPASVHPWEEKLLPREVGRHIGALGSFAARAHEKGKPKHVIDAFRDFASKAKARERTAEDSEPVALVEGILALQVWRLNPETDKNYAKLVDSLSDEWLSDMGIGVQGAQGFRRILIVSPARLAGGDFARSAQFRGKSAREILNLLKDAPGWMGPYSPRIARQHGPGGSLRTYGVNLDEFDRITRRTRPARDEATGPQISANTAASAASDQNFDGNAMFPGDSAGSTSAAESAARPLPDAASDPERWP